MRDGPREGRQHPVVGEVLFGGDAFHPLRHRGGLSVSLGGHLSGHAEGKRWGHSWRDDFIPGDPVCRLPVCGEEAGLRLEELTPWELPGTPFACGRTRSEERRVGKE